MVDSTAFATLRALLDGAKYATAVMPWGTPAPIALPADTTGRDALLTAHAAGGPANVDYAPLDSSLRTVRVERLQLAALTPQADGRCAWVAVDLDADTHGAGGLRDPDAAARCVAERADSLGLSAGLLIVASRSGRGRHAWLLFREALPLDIAALLIAYVGACVRLVADRDAAEGVQHAFRTGEGIAEPGQAGAFELLPRSEAPPRLGYALALPFNGAATGHGGGVALDVFTVPPRPIELDRVPACDPDAVVRAIAEARRALHARRTAPAKRERVTRGPRTRSLDTRTVELLAGAAPEGGRNRALYYAVGDMLRAGHTPANAESDLFGAAIRCGLPRHEAQATIRSAFRRARR